MRRLYVEIGEVFGRTSYALIRCVDHRLEVCGFDSRDEINRWIAEQNAQLSFKEQYELALAERKTVDVPPSPTYKKAARRPPQDDLERWALAGLQKLIALDADRASERNGAGFSKNDGEFGRSLVLQAGKYGLTDCQWSAAVKLAYRYKRQLGPSPYGVDNGNPKG